MLQRGGERACTLMVDRGERLWTGSSNLLMVKAWQAPSARYAQPPCDSSGHFQAIHTCTAHVHTRTYGCNKKGCLSTPPPPQLVHLHMAPLTECSLSLAAGVRW